MDTSTFSLYFGERLEYVRDDHALTTKAMAASVGVAPATWRKYEKDESFPSEKTLWKFCGVYHVNREWLNTSEGEIYTDGYKPGDPLGEPIDYREMIQQELTREQGIIFSEGSVQDRLNQIIDDLQEIQDRVAELSDELDSDTLEDAEADIDIVIGRIGDVIEEHGWKVR